jgi:hypothetical protein
MEVAQRREPEIGDINDAESEEIEVKEATGGDDAKGCLLRAVSRLGGRPR